MDDTAPGLAQGTAPSTAQGPAPDAAPRKKRVQSVLFMCNFNAVRSPAAEAIARAYFGKSTYVQSAGVRSGEPVDPFMVAALEEIGIDAARHKPRTLEQLDEWEGLNFDLIVTLAPEAHHAALELTRTLAVDVEYWPTPDPTNLFEASRDQRMDAYRDVRDGLIFRIKNRLKG